MKAIILATVLLFIHNAYGQIEGIVIDKKKTAIINAVIIVSDTTGKSIDTVTSDKRGGYFFEDLKPGKYNLEAKASGFQKAIYKNIVIITPPGGTDPNDDTYYAIRLDIILSPLKDQKK
jgi:hypothetical protein